MQNDILGATQINQYQPPLRDYDHNSSVHVQIDSLCARQSSTLSQAVARYSLRNNRPPPPNYDRWYTFARENQCLLDEYGQIRHDFEPFYQLAQEDPVYFKTMVRKGTAKVSQLFAIMIFAAFMPDMNILLNGRDEPRVVFNYRQPDMMRRALNVSDTTPFEHSPRSTAAYFTDMQCLVPNAPIGFTGLGNYASACECDSYHLNQPEINLTSRQVMIASSSSEFTTDLYPTLSMAKIDPCFADILVPSEFYYSDSPKWTPRYKHPNNVAWDDKIPRLYWRGKSSGGHISGTNYRAFPRFRAVDIGREHPHLMDVALSGFHDSLCGTGCDAAAIKAEYDIRGKSAPREDVYKYKYVLDLDGNSFSGRYFGLLRSGSLVFKVTMFAEYFNDWLRPFEHYIPVLPDLSDLVEKIEWAVAHDEEARAIQGTGEAFAERVLTDAQNDCYFSLVLLEWNRLQSLAETLPTGP
ncbi:glycosyl transferase family 90-domain-containing protein [Mycena crocata]|nr:glycosyl transferase family 90-domain-containing protein [Mycena crocata]